MEITRELFDEQRRPRFGTKNPDRMQLAFWEWMIRGNDTPPRPEEEGILAQFGLIKRRGVLKSCHGPWRARDLFNLPLNREEGPIWTFDRMGATRTELPDGRVICVGGEHEDYYDPDFCIYNDVIVFGPDDEIEIYGYPREVFPPTDFHTASLVDDTLILVGCLGYPDDRHVGHTPVYSLELSTYRISRIECSGEMPGWISDHEAEVDQDGRVIIRGGKVSEAEPRVRRNIEEYALDIRAKAWRRLTNRNWRQFSICREDGDTLDWVWDTEQRPEIEALLPRGVEHTVAQVVDLVSARILVRDVSVSIQREMGNIEIVIEGSLPDELTLRLAEDVRSNAEAAFGSRCILQEL